MEEEIKRLLFTEEPRTDESFVGYLLRLKDLNDYDTLSWVIQLAHIRQFARGGFSFCFNPALNLSRLSQLTGVNESKLVALLYHPVGVINGGMGDYLIFGQVVPRYVIRPERPKVCPACLREAEYARKVWELAPVTVCPSHRSLLLDECPNCARRISWIRPRVSRCRCGFDLRRHVSPPVEDSQLEATRYIYRLCNLTAKSNGEGDERAKNDVPLYKLDLQHFLSALFLIGSQDVGLTDTKGKNIGPSKRNLEIHALMCRAMTAFGDWPESFYSFLDLLRTGRKRAEYGGVSNDFRRRFYDRLYDRDNSPHFDFMRSAFEEYLLTRWDGGHTTVIGRIKKMAHLTTKYVSRQDAEKMLGVNYRAIDLHLAHGRLKGIVRVKRGKKIYLIERDGIVELKRELEQALYLKQVSSLLGIQHHRVLELIEAGFIKPISGPRLDGYGDWLVSATEVRGLLEKIRGKITKPRGARKVDIVGYAKSIKLIAQVGVKLPQFLNAILDGQVHPCGEDKKFKGLRGLIFPEQEISDYVLARVRESAKDAFRVREAADLLDLDPSTTGSLIRKGLLISRRTTDGPYPKKLVAREDLDSFITNYVLLSKEARKLKTSSNHLADLLMKKGIQPVSNGEREYVFKRRDLESVSLLRLVADARRQVVLKRKEPKVVSLGEAAEMLEVDSEVVQQLVENGVLPVYRNRHRKKVPHGGMCFSLITIKSYRGRIQDYIGLVTADVAAKMVGLGVTGLLVTYVKKGCLRAINPKGKSKPYYFNKQEVEALAALRELSLTTPKVAEALGVNITCVHKLKLAGILKPVSGPEVDGLGFHLYLRSDVERVLADRDAFKVKRLEEGRSARFGRRAGSQSSPVRSVVGPRIDQLVEEWQQQTPPLRITGQRLYQQLTSEGYQLGINTIYVHLREMHRRAA
jgi:hypothetical protein